MEVRTDDGIKVITLEKRVLGENDRYAAENRALFRERGLVVLNLISSPGAGKTTLLVESLRALDGKLRCAVIEGDQQTSNDARRIAETGVRVVQINTPQACHLNAAQVGKALEVLDLGGIDLLFIENVGNLICPTSYDLGEEEKVALLSVTEGEDKPLKYPGIFSRARLMLLTKTDLLPHLRFDVAACRENARRINADIRILEVSSFSRETLESWIAYLTARVAERRAGG